MCTLQVALGKNETKYEDMIEVMLDLHKYVPSKSVVKTVESNEHKHEIEEKLLCYL